MFRLHNYEILMIYGFKMIFVLVKLSRFVTPKEQEILIRDMDLKLRNYSKKVNVKEDPWGTRYRILISISENIALTKGLINTILSNPGVNNLIVFQHDLFDTRSDTLSQLMKTILKYIRSKTHSNTINVNFHALGRVPFHKKAILDRLKKKDIINDPKADFKLYIEVRQVQGKHLDDKGVQLRIGEKIIRQTKQPSSHIQTPKLVLFSPYTIQEVADFFRLALTFNTQGIITDENSKAEEIIQDVEKTYFKGIDKINFEIESSLDSLIDKKSECKFYGFSLWGKSPIAELKAEIKRNTNSHEGILFLFGNEETGLPLWIREKINIFHIGKKASEPLRASQAAAYVFGMMRI
jgi:tRNA(Leu) C34 or U34 (ribose-2'-O)-methylase TrmL